MSENRPQPPVWISHRGLKDQHEENTIAAFKAAVDAGFQWLETDLRCTADGELVLLHDPGLERVGGLDAKVSAMPAAAIRAIHLKNNGRVAFFDEFMEEFAGLSWTFDFKPEDGVKTVQAFIQWVEDRVARDWVTAQAKFLVWDAKQEAMLREHFPEVAYYAPRVEIWRAGLAVLAGLPALGGIKPGRTYSLPPKLQSINLYQSKYVEPFHNAGARVLAFLPNQETEVQAALASGFDEVLTDHSFARLRGAL